MNTTLRNLLGTLLTALALGASVAAHAQAKEEARLVAAAEVLDELRGQRDQLIPDWLLQRAYGVAVVPKVLKGAFIIGARRGNGVLSVRDSRGRFSSPVFINLTGGSVGFQWGAQESDIVLVFTTRAGVEGIADGKLTLGAGASVAAGPVGRQAEAAAGINAEVYAYSRTRGLFAGIALDGTALSMDAKSNRAFYGRKDLLTSDILNGAVTHDSESASRFLAALARSTGESAAAATAPTGAGTPPAQATPIPAAGPAPATSGSGVQTFPMEDPSPGQEPPR